MQRIYQAFFKLSELPQGAAQPPDDSVTTGIALKQEARGEKWQHEVVGINAGKCRLRRLIYYPHMLSSGERLQTDK